VQAGFGVMDDTDWAASARQHPKYHSAPRIKEAYIMPIRDSIRTDKLKASAPKVPLAADERCNGHQHRSSYLLLQINVICVLLFLIGTTLIVKHPDWFGGMPITVQLLAER
jgi:hypothetical protein